MEPRTFVRAQADSFICLSLDFMNGSKRKGSVSENRGLFLVTLLFGILVGICAFFVGYQSGYDDCSIAQKVRYSSVD